MSDFNDIGISRELDWPHIKKLLTIVLFASVERKGSGAGVGRTADAYAAAGIAAQAAEVAGAVAFGLWFASVSDGGDEIDKEQDDQNGENNKQDNASVKTDAFAVNQHRRPPFRRRGAYFM